MACRLDRALHLSVDHKTALEALTWGVSLQGTMKCNFIGHRSGSKDSSGSPILWIWYGVCELFLWL